MGCLEGSGVPVLYIGRTVPKGYIKTLLDIYAVPKYGLRSKTSLETIPFFQRVKMHTNKAFRILCFIDRASRYIHLKKTNLMHNLSSVYFVKHLYMFRAYL